MDTRPGRARFLKHALLLAGIALACRLAFLFLLPATVGTADLGSWSEVAAMLRRGQNPYAASTYLNWPPFWMQVIFVLHRVSERTGIPLTHVIRLFLIAVDVLNIVIALRIAAAFTDLGRATRALLLGLAVNPVALFLVCQQGNFDALVATSLLIAALALTNFRRTNEVTDWLIASFALGIGVLIKTIPLVVAPVLRLHMSSLARRARFLGFVLLVSPAAIGMSIIYVLSPRTVTQAVLRYRSYAGSFGITGLLQLFWPAGEAAYIAAFPIVAVIGLMLVAYWASRADLKAEQVVLLIGTMLVALLAFGPGYYSYYIAWPLPFFAIVFFAFDAQWKRDLTVIWIVTMLTYIIEYAFYADHGQLLIVIHPHPALRRIADVINDDEVRTLLRLPVFASYVWLLFAARARLRSAAAEPAARLQSERETPRAQGQPTPGTPAAGI